MQDMTLNDSQHWHGQLLNKLRSAISGHGNDRLMRGNSARTPMSTRTIANIAPLEALHL